MASTTKTVLITGSTRGIGLAFVEHYTKAGWNVIGTARANSNTEKVRYIVERSAFYRRSGYEKQAMLTLYVFFSMCS